MNNYVNSVKSLYEANAVIADAQPMKAYMKNLFEFLGLKKPLRKEISKGLLTKAALPPADEIEQVVKELWNLEYREFQYFAIGLLDKYVKKVPKDFIDVYEWTVINKSWWDTVDSIAASLVGPHFQRFPDLITPSTEKWMKSGNMWLQRTALLFQLRYKDETDFDLMTRYILELKDEKEFFIRKAIGWALREYSKTEPDAVISFVKQNKLAPLSEREALKVIERG